MSRSRGSNKSAVFHLNDGDIDFLDFERDQPEPIAVETKTKKSAAPRGKSARQIIDPDEMDNQAYTSTSIINRMMSGNDNQLVPEERELLVPLHETVKPGTNRKIPLKNVQEHQLLLNSLHAMASSRRFAPILDEFGIRLKDLHTKSIAELKEIRERARACCTNSTRQGGGIVSGIVLGVAGGAEKMCPKRLMDLDGYQEAIKANPEFEALCELIEIDSGFASSLTPIQRLGLCMTTTALTVGAQNRTKNTAMAANQSLIDNLKAQAIQQAKQQQQMLQSQAAPEQVSSNNNTRKPVPTTFPDY